jgi:hypothetical protein
VEQDGDGGSGEGFPEVGELAQPTGARQTRAAGVPRRGASGTSIKCGHKAAGVEQFVFRGDDVVNGVAVGVAGALPGEGVRFGVVAEEG